MERLHSAKCGKNIVWKWEWQWEISGILTHLDVSESRVIEAVHIVLVLACVLSHFSHVQLFATLWTITWQAPLSVGSSRQEYWSGLPCSPPGDLPKPGIKPRSLMSALTGGFLTTSEYFRSICFSGYFFLFPLSPAPEAACLQPAATIRANQENRSHCRFLKWRH